MPCSVAGRLRSIGRCSGWRGSPLQLWDVSRLLAGFRSGLETMANDSMASIARKVVKQD
jgi:hypothetical protein